MDIRSKSKRYNNENQSPNILRTFGRSLSEQFLTKHLKGSLFFCRENRFLKRKICPPPQSLEKEPGKSWWGSLFLFFKGFQSRNVVIVHLFSMKQLYLSMVKITTDFHSVFTRNSKLDRLIQIGKTWKRL